jgi:hypothetical protein
VFQSPWGENLRLQEGAGAFIDQAQPTDLRAVAQAHAFGGIDLPALMRSGGPLIGRRCPPPFGRRTEAGAGEVALQGAFAGHAAVGVLLGQQHANQPGPPAGVLAAHVERGSEQLGIGRGLVLPATVVGWGEAVGAVGAEAGIEFADGAWAQAQSAGNLVGGVTLRGACADDLALGKGHSTRHGKPPGRNTGKKLQSSSHTKKLSARVRKTCCRI